MLKIYNVNISETVRANAKNEYDNFQRFVVPTNDTIAKVVPRDIDLVYIDNKLEMLISLKQWELAQTC